MTLLVGNPNGAEGELDDELNGKSDSEVKYKQSIHTDYTNVRTRRLRTNRTI